MDKSSKAFRSDLSALEKTSAWIIVSSVGCIVDLHIEGSVRPTVRNKTLRVTSSWPAMRVQEQTSPVSSGYYQGLATVLYHQIELAFC